MELTSFMRSGYEAAGEIAAEGTLVLEELKDETIQTKNFDFLFIQFI